MNLLDRVFYHLQKSVDDGRRKREIEAINKRVEEGQAKLDNAAEDLQKMLDGKLSKAELEELSKKLS